MFLSGHIIYDCLLRPPPAEDKTIWETGMYLHVCAFASGDVSRVANSILSMQQCILSDNQMLVGPL